MYHVLSFIYLYKNTFIIKIVAHTHIYIYIYLFDFVSDTYTTSTLTELAIFASGFANR